MKKNLAQISSNILNYLFNLSVCICICTIYWVDQKVRMGFSVRCHGKTQTNFSANPIYNTMHVCINSRIANSYLCEKKKLLYRVQDLCVVLFLFSFTVSSQCFPKVLWLILVFPSPFSVVILFICNMVRVNCYCMYSIFGTFHIWINFH